MVTIKDFASYCTTDRGWTAAFEQAIAALDALGGGLLYVPAGSYETCSIELKSNITLYLESGAELKFIQDAALYRVVQSEFEGRSEGLYMPCIYAKEAEHVTVCGHGTINGQGSYWWEARKTLPHSRPYLICFERCNHVKILDVRLINSPVWTVHPLYCNDVEVRGVTIRNPWDSPNTDGINPDSCCNVRIADCLVDVGDDCITLKSGTEETPVKAPCENITITNCNMVHGHGGVVIGSEMSGNVRNVVISNCVFQDTDRGIRVKTRRGRGGSMESILVSNVMMDRVLCPFVFNMYYRCGMNGGSYKDKFAHDVDSGTPMIRNIQIQNCMVTDARAAAGFFYGLPEMPIDNVKISDCTIRMKEGDEGGDPAMMEDLPKMAQEGIFMRHAANVVFRNVQVIGSVSESGWDVDETVS
ncbi:MAG: glycoside hydrolase family 28 protein [Lachnospiraceae bacterium]|nr:glycoside hydrolase family 28 protein [Lachnospiraceae bacterium]